jgi:hypothetical protein
VFQDRVALDGIQRFLGQGQALGVGHQIDAREQPDVEIQETGHGAAAAAQIQVERTGRTGKQRLGGIVNQRQRWPQNALQPRPQ